ncbi:MAG: lipid A deacylase LpxR family protein [Bacteroidota bacterium]
MVNHKLTEIAPITTKVPITESIFNPTYTIDFKKVINPITLINIVFDNDIFDNTDYYFTNGIYFELITPLANQSPLSNVLLGLRKSKINLQGFSIRQNIYTPTNPDVVEISVGDRPFSAFLTMGQFRHSYNINKKISIKSSINFGVLGPASMGDFVQSSIHNIEPVGWTNQINNNIIIDYQVNIEKGIVSNPHIELNLTAGGNVGTIFNKINAGLYFRTGSFIPVFRGPSTIYGTTTKKSNIQYWFFVSGQTNLVFYDATLQGSMFATNSPYVIQSKNINRLVVNLSVGFALYYKKVGFELQNFYLSPEFTDAYDFRWGQIKLVFQL